MDREVVQTNVLPRPPSSAAAAAHVFTDEADHAFIQQRLGLLYGVFGLILAGFYVAGVLLMVVFHPNLFWVVHLAPAKLLHLVATTGVLSGAAFCRGKTRPRWALSVIDFGAMLTVMSIGSAVVYLLPREFRADFLGLVPLMMLGCLRAALVPSPPRWTVLVMSVAAIPMPIASWQRALGDPSLQGELSSPSTILAFCTASSVSAVIAAYVISKVVYGLRAEVKSAMKLGQYTLEEEIGRGGMGSVHRARHALLRRPTAIKLLAPDRQSSVDVKRFEREVQLTSMLTHPNTVAIYDFGHTRDGVFYYAMELLDGVSLEKLVEEEGPQEPPRVLHILLQIVGALAEAHEVGLIHRDVKPANIFLTSRGGIKDFIKVLDFGLVKDVKTPDPSLSSTDAIAGTPLYMAPESILDPTGIDARVDIYAVGAVGYWLLTGTPPFEGTNLIEICSHHLHTPVERPSERLGRPIREDLEQVLVRCLAKSREDRPASARALGDLLETCRNESARPAANSAAQ
jgi:serine/threonine-protein kinase